ncbi:MAG: hypothetical protein IPJ65_28310 [Archangiaceae bacterium]|nr:hypothetical protein [Archangiaceae bacterium]
MRSALTLVLVLAACSAPNPPVDAGEPGTDGGREDAGTQDAGTQDAGTQDAGTQDAGTQDAGTQDAGVDAGRCATAPRDDAGGYTALTVIGDTGSGDGIYDPSLFYEADGGGGFMTYTSVPTAALVHTRIAFSQDHGTSWVFLGDVNVPKLVTLATSDRAVCDAGTCDGLIVHETSSIIADLTDPVPARRFKVFTHTYFFSAVSGINYPLGYLSMFTTAFPLPDAGWVETKLLGWPSSSPFSSLDAGQNLATDPRLSGMRDCLLLTEPGAVMRGSTIDLVVACLVPSAALGEIYMETRLLRSEDHGATWSFVSTLVNRSEALALGASGGLGPQASGPALFTWRGAEYLSITPNGPVGAAGNGYRGCLVLGFSDLDAGTLEKCGGAPVVKKAFLGFDRAFTGPCTFAEGATSPGMLVPTADLTATPKFRINASKQDPL